MTIFVVVVFVAACFCVLYVACSLSIYGLFLCWCSFLCCLAVLCVAFLFAVYMYLFVADCFLVLHVVAVSLA